ncbi:MAG TPA: GNAT family N-acetyltransferase [Steroidobacteraceae bacterium]|nr:GNAT family N-acetyltransferase [Steroidobacteraceae bacterium]
MAGEVRDNPARNRFELELGGGVAFLTYSVAAGVRTLLHAEVPPELEGRGHGSALVKGTLDLIRASGEKVIPRCPFVDAYMRRHPAYEDLRA